jgi:hypothetical protein
MIERQGYKLGNKRLVGHLRAAGIAALLLAPMLVAPAVAQAPRIGQVTDAAGAASILRGGAHVAARPGDPVYQGDVVETGADGRIVITFLDSTRFSTGPESQLALPQFQFDTSTQRGSMTAEIRQGTLGVVSGAITHNTPGALHIKTPTSVLGVRGTTFGIQVTGNPPKEKFIVFPNAGGGSGAISVGAAPAAAGGAPAR